MFINSYLSKNNTLIKNSRVNMGKNPIVELFYGGENKEFSRFVFKLDLTHLKHLREKNGYFENDSTVKHFLRMTNTSFINYDLNKNTFLGKDRANSFILNLYYIPQDFSEGRGYDQHKTGFTVGRNIYDEQPSNFFKASDIDAWVYGFGGINETLTPIATQTFLDGNENLNMDITDYVNQIIHNENFNQGSLILAFAPELEEMTSDSPKYVGFFSRHAKSIYSPLVQSIDYNMIQDDRHNFVTNKTNRLYYYYKRNGEFVDPPSIPQVDIKDDYEDIIATSENGGVLRVIRQQKGIYYVEFNLEDFAADLGNCTAYYDVWSFPSSPSMATSELSFTPKQDKAYDFGEFNGETTNELSITSKGLNKGSIINRGGKIDVIVLPKIKYTYGQYDNNVKIFYSMYVREGNQDINVINNGNTYSNDNVYYDNILKMDTFTDGSKHFIIDSMSLTPNRYYIDLYVYQNGLENIIKEFIYFDVK